MLDKLVTEVSTIEDLEQIYLENFLNHTSKVSKISDLSVLSAHAFAVSKLLQKKTKDTAILESQLFPELAYGGYLDSAVKRVTGLERLTASGSSTYLLVNADPGTLYIPGETTFTSTEGVVFNLVDIGIIGEFGFNYLPVRSQSYGANTNVNPLTITVCNNPPLGHINCVNEYRAEGGRDSENDIDFKQRISTFSEFVAKGTLYQLLENLRTINNDIIKVSKLGVNDEGKIVISILTCNGKDFTTTELVDLENRLSEFLSVTDIQLFDSIGIVLRNTEWHQVGNSTGIDFRLDILPGYSEVEVRKNIQLQLSKYFDFRFWNSNKVEWDDLLQIVKNVKGVKYVYDEYFLPNADHAIEKGKYPRVIKFIMRNSQGNILYNNVSDVLPIYYQ